MPTMHRVRKIAVLTAVAALAGCGGGGGSSGAAAESLPTVDVSAVASADPGSTLPAAWQHGPFAEIYVRGYQDSNGDGIGDLRGLISRLDYLKALGVTGLWLMPVTNSQDHDHGYAVVDYRGIESDYGSLADFDELLKQAHARGIGVIVDYVINHSAYQNPLFTHSRAAADNPYRDWYIWQTSAPSGWNIYGNNPWYGASNGAYFAGFWSQMPDFNLRNTAVLNYHRDSLRFWLDRGVDGFRFDAVGNLVENGPSAWENQPEDAQVMGQMHQVVAAYANRWMVCEAPGLPQRYAAGDACGASFAFGHQSDIVNAAKGNASAVAAVANYFVGAPSGMATLVSNHDAFAGQRLWDQVSGDLAQYRLAAATYLLQPGTPFIYYGEEIGLAGAASLSGDWKLRTPMSWSADASTAGFTSGTPFRALSANAVTHNVAAQQADPSSLLSFYKNVIALRKSRASLARGGYAGANANAQVMSFRRVLDAEQTLVLFNYGSAATTATANGLPTGTTLHRLWPAGAADAAADAGGQASVTLPARSFAVFAVGDAVATVSASPSPLTRMARQ